MSTLYKKIERQGVIEFAPISVPMKEEAYLQSLISKNNLIEDLALYLSNSTAGKSYKQIAEEIINLKYIKEAE